MGEIAIHTQNLGKTYNGAVYAVHDLALEIPSGAVFGFLGPNGAGKTTTVKLLAGLLRPTEGSCTVLGLSPVQQPSEVHRLCGVVTETAKMYGRLTGMENLIFFGQALGLEKRESRQRAEVLLKSFDLWDLRDRCLSSYSTGTAQLLSLARAMILKPRLLLLDEPAGGLDPESVARLGSMILDLVRRAGITVFLCTHQLRYAQNLCDSYGVIQNGKMLACGDLVSLSREVGLPLRAEFRLREGNAPEGFKRLNDGRWSRNLEDEDEMPALVKRLVASGCDLYEARLMRPSLEEVYFKLLEFRGDVK